MSLTNYSPARDLERHLMKRPERPKPLPEVSTPEWEGWYVTYIKWVDRKHELEFLVAHGRMRLK